MGDLGAARHLFDESLTLETELGNAWGIGFDAVLQAELAAAV